ncbi:MAG: ABC transporter permease [Acidobacteria bacterium]|nr:ABC transporter permease [Acidobacteriota bacterium]
MSGFLHDLAYSFRTLRKSPGFAVVSILSLALGIGATTAVFSLADALALKPSRLPDPGNLVRISSKSPQWRFGQMSYREFTTLREQTATVGPLAAYAELSAGVQMQDREVPRVTLAAAVNADFFRQMRVPVALGRDFEAADDKAGSQPVALITASYHERKFGGHPAAVGSRLRVNGKDFVIAGVLPRTYVGFTRYTAPEVYVPLQMIPLLEGHRKALDDPARRSFALAARLKPGVPVTVARTEVEALAARMQQAYPETNKDLGATVLSDPVYWRERQPTDATLGLLLLGLTVLLLAIASANVANLLLGRGQERAREISVRLAVGAGRWRLVRQLLTESLVLGAAGGLVGLALGTLGIRFFQSIRLPTDFPIVIPIALDGRVLAWTAAASGLTVFLFGLVPALRATRTDLVTGLKGAAVRPGRLWGRQALVSIQVAFAVVLVVETGLFTISFWNALRQRPGFRTEGVLTAAYKPRLVGYTEEKSRRFYEQILERVREQPGVRSASLAATVPTADEEHDERIYAPGDDAKDAEKGRWTDANIVSDGYFDNLAIPVVRGRAFDRRDTARSLPVAIVNETFAQESFSGRDAVGQVIYRNGRAGKAVTIIGVAKNSRYRNVLEAPREFVYVPFSQVFRESMTIHVETEGDPLAFTETLRTETRALDPDMPMFNVFTVEDIYEHKGQLAARLVSQVTGVTGAIGIALAAVGLYAVIAFLVSRNTREIGVRMALGATPAHVVRAVLSQGLIPVALGAVAGVSLAVPVSGIFSEFLTQLRPPLETLIALACGLLAVVSLAAMVVPARRAARIDPSRALRWD